MKKVIALLLVSYVAQAADFTYLQRFRALPQHSNAVSLHKFSTALQIKKTNKLVQQYPWLEELEQPTVMLENSNVWYGFDNPYWLRRLPRGFYSNERTVITYADGTVVTHLLVSEDTPDYQQFLLKTHREPPMIVSIRDSYGTVLGEYLYTERTVNYLHAVFSLHDFRFEGFLDKVESPIVNVAAGGFHFAWLLNRFNIDRQQDLPREEQKYINSFSLDISGQYRTYISNPWYLFGNMYATGLPDNTFGAATVLGSPLKRQFCPRNECVEALHELGRIVKPNGRLLIEYTMPKEVFISMLEESGLTYLDFSTYEGREGYSAGERRETQLIEILLDKD